MSTVAEIRQAIDRLNSEDRYLLMAQLFAELPTPDDNDPNLVAILDEALLDDDADRIYSIEEVRARLSKWTSALPSPNAP